ncbi:MAG: hypothetical protein WC054_01690 [Candidatus Nanopelagicales bacterium]
MIGIAVIALAASLVAGIVLGQRSINAPERYWGFLGAGLVLTTALMLGGYTWYDEAFLAGLVLGNPPRLGADSKRKRGGFWWGAFVIFCVYSLVEGIRGLIYFTDIGVGDPIQKLRWIVLFVLILAVAVKGKQLADSGVQPRDTAVSIARAGLIFSLIYLPVGVISFLTSGTFGNTQYAQTTVATSGANPLLAIFSSTGYATIVYLVVVPAALICMCSKASNKVGLGATTLILAFVSQVAYNSRTGMVYIVLGFVIYLITRAADGKVRVLELLLIPVMIAIPIGVTSQGETKLEHVVTDLAETLHLTETTSSLQDIDRQIWFKSGFDVLGAADGIHKLFGYGSRTSGYEVAPYVTERFFIETGKLKETEDVAVESITAIAVDSGYVGLLLFGALTLGGIVFAARSAREFRWLLVPIPVGVVLISLVANVFDAAIMYVALMPFGLIYAMGRRDTKSDDEATADFRSVTASPSIHRSNL